MHPEPRERQGRPVLPVQKVHPGRQEPTEPQERLGLRERQVLQGPTGRQVPQELPGHQERPGR